MSGTDGQHGIVFETAIERLESVSRACGAEVFIKRDDQSNPRYGGNKPRKLAPILDRATRDGRDTLLTAGTVGSHHALATAVHGRARGFEVHAVLAPQPRTRHAETVIRATLSQGAIVHPCPTMAGVVPYLAALWAGLTLEGRRVRVIPVGGSDVTGASGYFDAMLEVRAQIERGAMGGQWPDSIVCAHGSGGTHAGLLAAQKALTLPTRVLGVMVALPWTAPRLRTAMLAREVLWAKARGRAGAGATVRARDVELVMDQLGDGYGARTEAGDRATELLAADGIVLDPTYTAKTAAAVIELARSGRAKRVLFWHTLSSAPYGPLTSEVWAKLPASIDGLLKG